MDNSTDSTNSSTYENLNITLLNSTNSTNTTSSLAATLVKYNEGQDLGSFILVALMAVFGGFAIQCLNGLHIPAFKCFKGINTPPLLGKVKLPPLIGMTVMGMIARNCFGIAVNAY